MESVGSPYTVSRQSMDCPLKVCGIPVRVHGLSPYTGYSPYYEFVVTLPSILPFIYIRS
jgi:hypothetical protein